MTKKEKALVDKAFMKIMKSSQRRLVEARKFRKNAKLGMQLVVVPIKTVIKEWRKLAAEVKT